MDPAMISLLVSQGLRIYADIADRNAKGEVTDADMDKMLALIGHNLETFQAQIDAKRKP